MNNVSQVAHALSVSIDVAEKAVEYGLVKLAHHPEKGPEILGVESHAILVQEVGRCV
ncbi:hypothetical protein [Marinospirillum minutulum]|uniref:hypothetical protein n=1 Tax=Marinospirillum minutulum TaxID=64974 RepID=UPI0012EB4E4D|nr:hypothetical protein [Marinospirillum minutulum]